MGRRVEGLQRVKNSQHKCCFFQRWPHYRCGHLCFFLSLPLSHMVCRLLDLPVTSEGPTNRFLDQILESGKHTHPYIHTHTHAHKHAHRVSVSDGFCVVPSGLFCLRCASSELAGVSKPYHYRESLRLVLMSSEACSV